jgi:hypothetical protein
MCSAFSRPLVEEAPRKAISAAEYSYVLLNPHFNPLPTGDEEERKSICCW